MTRLPYSDVPLEAICQPEFVLNLLFALMQMAYFLHRFALRFGFHS
jgi:hypothetical protein